jgi:anti-anti-sigma factor
VTTHAEIAVERRRDNVLAHLGGEVDMTNATYVRDELLASVPNDVMSLVIDLSGCRYLDSAAIEVLFDLSRRLQRRRQELRLVVPDSSPLARVLVLTQVGAVAAVHQTVDGALGQ